MAACEYTHKLKAIPGAIFGDLVVIEDAERTKHGHRAVLCRCSCGREKIIATNSLVRGLTKSCGCKQRTVTGNKNRKHGKYGTKVYHTWQTMIQRCSNQNSDSFTYYGAKGITVCDEWKRFEQFFSDMGDPPSEQYSIDRIDPRGNYCKENCRWSTSKEQANNKTNNRLITIHDETHTLAEWAEKFNIPYDRALKRLNMGYGPMEALTAPLGRRKQQPDKQLID